MNFTINERLNSFEDFDSLNTINSQEACIFLRKINWFYVDFQDQMLTPFYCEYPWCGSVQLQI